VYIKYLLSLSDCCEKYAINNLLSLKQGYLRIQFFFYLLVTIIKPQLITVYPGSTRFEGLICAFDLHSCFVRRAMTWAGVHVCK